MSTQARLEMARRAAAQAQQLTAEQFAQQQQLAIQEEERAQAEYQQMMRRVIAMKAQQLQQQQRAAQIKQAQMRARQDRAPSATERRAIDAVIATHRERQQQDQQQQGITAVALITEPQHALENVRRQQGEMAQMQAILQFQAARGSRAPSR